jgi:hypothetical protein
MALNGYGTPDQGSYTQQAADIGYRYNTDRANNAYGRFLSQQRGSRSLTDLSNNFNQGLPDYKASFAHRGLQGPGVTSGVMQRSMGNYLGDYTTQYGRLQQDAQQEAQNYDLQGAQMDALYNNSLAALEQQKQQDIANAALAIEAMRPFLGGV